MREKRAVIESYKCGEPPYETVVPDFPNLVVPTPDAYGCIFSKDSETARQQADELMGAGWKFEVPSRGAEPWQWQWRAPAKRKGSKGRLYLSTNQAYRALKKAKP